MKMKGDTIYLYNEKNSYPLQNQAKNNPNFEIKSQLPESFDWRNKGGHSYIGGIKAQGNCGSCYAFGATACAEGTYNYVNNRYDNNVIDFSESYIAWCLGNMTQYSNHFGGCNGADYDYA